MLFQPNNLSGRGFGVLAGGKKGKEEIADCGFRIADLWHFENLSVKLEIYDIRFFDFVFTMATCSVQDTDFKDL